MNGLLWRPTWLLTVRAIVQLPRIPVVLVFSLFPAVMQLFLFGTIFGSLTRLPDFPTGNYYEYLAPAIVFMTAVFGIANSGVALVEDFQSGYFQKVLIAPISKWSILLGRLFADGVRVYVSAAAILLLSLAMGAEVASGVAGALLLLLLAVLFSIVTVGVLVANVGLKTKDAQAVQAVFPVFFILMFLTTAFMPKSNIDSDIAKTLMDLNPAQYVVEALQSLMLVGWEWGKIAIAAAVIVGFGALTVPLTIASYRSVYK